MADAVLIYPCLDFPFIRSKKFSILNKIWPPLSLAYSAALLEREGFDVKVIDANAERLSPGEIIDRMGDSGKIFITTSTLDRWQCPHLDLTPFLEVIKEIRRQRPKSKIFVTGVHGTVRPKEVLKITGADALIIGEPEFTILDICRGNEEARGMAFERDGEMVFTEPREPVNLDELPMPAFHQLPMEKYFYEFLGDRFTLFEGSRSCPFECVYCLKKMYGRYRKKSAENLIKEVENAIEKFGVRNAYFIDLEFTINRELVEGLCDFLAERKYNFSWCCQSRLDSIDPELLKKMKRAGCRLIHYGVETGSPRIMEMINKKITLEQIERGMEMTRKAGIDTACFFMFGLPGETEKEMEMTINFAKKINPTYASFHVAIPYPGTIFYEKIKDSLDSEDLFPVYYEGECSHEFLDKMVKRAFKEFYLRPKCILSRFFKNPKFFWRQAKLFLSYVR